MGQPPDGPRKPDVSYRHLTLSFAPHGCPRGVPAGLPRYPQRRVPPVGGPPRGGPPGVVRVWGGGAVSTDTCNQAQLVAKLLVSGGGL